MEARVQTLVVSTTTSIVVVLYNTDQEWAQANIYWSTAAQYDYDAPYSGGFCQHV